MTIEQSLPKYPDRALKSRAVLYRPLQDVDIYVEDEGSEVFYNELIKRLAGDIVRISTVIPLRSRQNVITAANKYKDARRALFLIDADLQWVSGEEPPDSPLLFMHPCYCVENYLFCERAMIQVAVENSGALTEDSAKAQLAWDRLHAFLKMHLVPLFIEYAVAFSLCPEIKTVARGIGCILHDAKGGVVPEIDPDKVRQVKEEMEREIVKRVRPEDYRQTKASIETKVAALSDPLDIVSGKDYLIPVQMFEVSRVGRQKVQRKSFVFRLARHCDLQKLGALKERIKQIVEPKVSIEATA